MRNKRHVFQKKTLAWMLALSMAAQPAAGAMIPAVTAEAATADSEISIINYYDAKSAGMVTMDAESKKYSFVMPRMNGEESYDNGYEGAYTIEVKQDGNWVAIDSLLTRVQSENALTEEGEDAYAITYWSDSNFSGWGFSAILSENFGSLTTIRFKSKSHEVSLEYKLVSTIEKMFIEDADGDNKTTVGKNESFVIGWDHIKFNDGDTTATEYGTGKFTWKVVIGGEEKAADDYFGAYDSDNWGWALMEPNHGTWFNAADSLKIRAYLTETLTSGTPLYAEYEVTIATATPKGPEWTGATSADVADPGTNKAGYNLVWADEFNGNYSTANVDEATGLNLDNWSYQLGNGMVAAGLSGWGNGEKQSYTKSPDNIKVENGMLRITAAYEEEGVSLSSTDGTQYYSSARIVTKGDETTGPLFNTTYGYVEARMALPETQGAWPAFWMLPQSTDIYGPWPVSGEIDIMETTGLHTNEACSTLHYGTPDHVYLGSGYVEMDQSISKMHTYAVDWAPGKITFYYDGEEVYTQTNWESKIPGSSDSLAFDAPFDQPYYILLNLAVDSGTFGGTANKALFTDDINMYVDYVRVYHKNGGYDTEDVVRTVTDANTDWQNYEGQNLIADISEATVEEATNGDVNALEKAEGGVDASKWYLAYGASGAGTVDVVEKDGVEWAKVDVTAPGSETYGVQLIGHYDAKPGYLYKISMDAYAQGGLVGQTVSFDSKEWLGWSTYGISSFTLEDSPRSYSFLIDQKSLFEDCRMEVNLGAVGTGTAYISNVKVEIVDPAMLGEDPQRDSKPLANGDYIYNGTFDQGTNRVGYWDAVEGTTFKVPSYSEVEFTAKDVSVLDVAADVAAGGVMKYYERRAEISAQAGTEPAIYQSGMALAEGEYTLTFDMYSPTSTSVKAALYSVNTDENGNETLGTKLLESRAITTSSNPQVVPYAWTFETIRDLKNAAIVISFGDGSSVLLDNVAMYSADKVDASDSTNMDKDVNAYKTITYVMNDSRTEPAVNADSNPFYYTKGEGTITLAEPTRAGYKFAGWSTVQEVQYVEQYITEVSTNADSITLYANWGERVTESEGNRPVAVTGVTVAPTTLALTVGDTATLTATVAPENATTQTVEWSVDKPEIATVEDGEVTAVAAGTAVITVTTTDGNKKATCTVTVSEEEIVNAATPVIVTNPLAANYNAGAEASPLQIGATIADNGILSYQWYKNDTNSTENGVAIDDATESTYVPDVTEAGITYYYCEVTNTNTQVNGVQTATVTSTAAKITVTAQDAEAPLVVGPLSDVTMTMGDEIVELQVFATANDGGVVSYQWYVNTEESEEGATAIEGATASRFKPETVEVGTLYYYCIVTSTNPDATGEEAVSVRSDIVSYEVTAAAVVDAQTPTITENPASANYNAGTSAVALKVTATVTDGGNLSYQWYKNTVASTTGGAAITGATSAEYIPNIATAGTAYYYCVVTNKNTGVNGVQTASATSQVATIAAKGTDVSTPIILSMPQAASYVYGQNAAALSVQVFPVSDGTLTYQWYISNTAAANGTAIAGATAASYVPSTTAAGVKYYYCVVTNTNANATGTKIAKATTSVVPVTVLKAAGTINVASTINKTYSTKAFNLNATGNGTLTYVSSSKKIATVDATGKVKMKNTGKVTITITASGDANHNATSTKVVINIAPKKVTKLKVKSTATGTATVTWKKNAKTTGYEIQYSTNSKFKKAKTVTITKNKSKKPTKMISKLKAGKKYYVRIRAYKNKAKAKRVYSKWTSKKKVTIMK